MGGHHDHSHSHDRSHGHGHDDSGGSQRKIAIAAILTGTFMVAEAVGGIISGSLALLADAGHMLIDFAGLCFAYFAIRLSKRPASARNTFGLARLPILVAFGNGLVLFFIAGIIIVEAARRLADPVEILAGPMLVIAIGGLVVNIVAFLVLHGGDKEDLNLRGAILHVMGDLLGSVAAIGASLVIIFTGWTPVDPILSVLVCLIILVNAWRLVRDSGHILLEGAPEGVEASTVRPQLVRAVPGLIDVHHFHVWTITPKKRAATLHARVAEGTDAAAAVRAIKQTLSTDFAIAHATVELEFGESLCADAGEADCGAKPGALKAHAHEAEHDARAGHGHHPAPPLAMIGAPA